MSKTNTKHLVIVESPAKAKTINKILGKNYKVEASVGHIIDLPKSKFGVDLDNGYQPQYTVIRGKSKVIQNLKKEAKTADTVLLATLTPTGKGKPLPTTLPIPFRKSTPTFAGLNLMKLPNRRC